MSYYPPFDPYYEDDDTVMPDDDEDEVHREIDGIYCSRCGDRLSQENYGWDYDPYDYEPCDCIACAECGEYNTCICEDLPVSAMGSLMGFGKLVENLIERLEKENMRIMTNNKKESE